MELRYRVALPAGMEAVARVAVEERQVGVLFDRALWVLSEVAKRTALGRYQDGGFAPLGYDFLERGCPRNQLTSVLSLLREAGLIECDGRYRPASTDPNGVGKSLGYRLGKGWRGRPLESTPGRSRSVQASLTKNYQRRQREADPLPPLYRELDRLAKRIRLMPDPAAAEVDDLLEPENRYALVDEFGWRFHESHQRVPKVHRRRLRLGESDEPLRALDVTASQPLILCALVREQADRERQTGGGRRREGERERGRGEGGDHNESQDSGAVLSDVGGMIDAILGDTLYDRVAAGLTALIPAGGDPYREARYREDGKLAFMMFAMGTPAHMLRSKAGKTVRRLWPHFWGAVYRLARDNPRNHIARVLQRRESDLMLRTAAARILRERSDVEFGTVHDAIVCHPRHVPFVLGCIEDAYREGLGVVPQVKDKPYGD